MPSQPAAARPRIRAFPRKVRRRLVKSGHCFLPASPETGNRGLLLLSRQHHLCGSNRTSQSRRGDTEMDERNRGQQQGGGMEDREQKGGNMPDNQKKPAQGEKQGEGMEDRNRGQNQGQGGERKSA